MFGPKGAIELQKDYDGFKRKPEFQIYSLKKAMEHVHRIAKNQALYAERLQRTDSLTSPPQITITWIKENSLFADATHKIPVVAQVRCHFATKVNKIRGLNLAIALPILLGLLLLVSMFTFVRVTEGYNNIMTSQEEGQILIDKDTMLARGVRLKSGDVFMYTSEGKLPPIYQELLPMEWEYVWHPDWYCGMERI